MDGWMVGCLVGWTLELWSFVVCSFLQIFSSIVSYPILSYLHYMYSVSTYFTRREREPRFFLILEAGREKLAKIN